MKIMENGVKNEGPSRSVGARKRSAQLRGKSTGEGGGDTAKTSASEFEKGQSSECLRRFEKFFDCWRDKEGYCCSVNLFWTDLNGIICQNILQKLRIPCLPICVNRYLNVCHCFCVCSCKGKTLQVEKRKKMNFELSQYKYFSWVNVLPMRKGLEVFSDQNGRYHIFQWSSVNKGSKQFWI